LVEERCLEGDFQSDAERKRINAILEEDRKIAGAYRNGQFAMPTIPFSFLE
jgi:hypothetical protein